MVVSLRCFHIIGDKAAGKAVLIVVTAVGVGVDAELRIHPHIAVKIAGDIQLLQIAVTIQIGEEGTVQRKLHHIGGGNSHVLLIEQFRILCETDGCRLFAVAWLF